MDEAIAVEAEQQGEIAKLQAIQEELEKVRTNLVTAHEYTKKEKNNLLRQIAGAAAANRSLSSQLEVANNEAAASKEDLSHKLQAWQKASNAAEEAL